MVQKAGDKEDVDLAIMVKPDGYLKSKIGCLNDLSAGLMKLWSKMNKLHSNAVHKHFRIVSP